MITIVSGLARCGSSMTMQMLYAGGMECCGVAPAFEDSRSTQTPSDLNWLSECDGMAVKLLWPGDVFSADCLASDYLPKLRYRVIWLDRHPQEQAKSWIKTLRHLGHVTSRKEIVPHRKMLAESRQRNIEAIKNNADSVLFLRFESVLKDPRAAAVWMRDLVGIDLDVDAMAAVVVDRKPGCLPYLLEKRQLEERNG